MYCFLNPLLQEYEGTLLLLSYFADNGFVKELVFLLFSPRCEADTLHILKLLSIFLGKT